MSDFHIVVFDKNTVVKDAMNALFTVLGRRDMTPRLRRAYESEVTFQEEWHTTVWLHHSTVGWRVHCRQPTTATAKNEETIYLDMRGEK